MDVRVGAVEFRHERRALEVAEQARLLPEAVRTGDIEVRDDAPTNLDVRGDNEHSPLRYAEGEHCHQAGLATPNRNLENRMLRRGREMLPSGYPALSLRLAEIGITLDPDFLVEKLSGFVVSHGRLRV